MLVAQYWDSRGIESLDLSRDEKNGRMIAFNDVISRTPRECRDEHENGRRVEDDGREVTAMR